MKTGLGLIYVIVGLLSTVALYAEQAPAGVAAVVNGQPISFAELDKQIKDELPVLSTHYQGTELEAKTRELKERKLHTLIDRDLLIQSFYKTGGKIPDSFIDDRVNDIIQHEYGGDRTSFERTLQERDITLKAYREEIADNLIVGYMRTKNITDKIPKDLVDEKDRTEQAQLLSKVWFDSLRKNAEIKTYLP